MQLTACYKSVKQSKNDIYRINDRINHHPDVKQNFVSVTLKYLWSSNKVVTSLTNGYHHCGYAHFYLYKVSDLDI